MKCIDLESKRTMKGINLTAVVYSFADILFKILQIVASIWFRIWYKKPKEEIPPITNNLLLESATSLAKKIRNKQVTSVEVVQAFISRIKEVNPILNCVVDERFEEALEEAKKTDELIATESNTVEEMESNMPFLGVPFTVKLCVSVKGFKNTAGLYSRRKIRATEDADVVLRLRKAGAIPLASTNVSELCLWWESFNPVHGRTNNPYNTNHTAGGSSGGEGSVLASAASPMGLGSDIGGSIRIPAFFNGVFGHKPTNGIGPLKGHFPYPRYPSLRNFLVIGPMSRFATDLLPMYKVIAEEHVEELKLSEKVDITKLRYYFMEDDSGSILVSTVEPEIKLAVRKILYYLKKQHGIAVHRADLRKLSNSMIFWFSKMMVADGPMIAKELANGEGDTNVFLEIFKFILGISHHTLPVLATAALEQISMKYSDSKHIYVNEKCSRLKKEFQDMLGDDGVFIYPTLPTAAPHHVEPITKPFDISYTAVFNCLGLPSTHCPMGLNSQGLPIGVQIVAAEKQDRLTLAVAEELERAFGGWINPTLLV